MSSINKPATPWADTPFPLIATPGRGQDLTSIHSSIFIARDMACAHNALLRALNSIYNQCIYVSKTQDIIDLLTYTKFWIDWIHEHHQAEERMLFPDIERISGIKGWREGNVSQHEAFLAGMERLEGFVKGFLGEGSNDAGGLKTGQKWNGIQMRVMIDGFAGDLTKHLRDEIDTLLALEPYDSMALRKAYDAFDLELRKGDKVCHFFLFLNPDLMCMLAYYFMDHLRKESLTQNSPSYFLWSWAQVIVVMRKDLSGQLCLAL